MPRHAIPQRTPEEEGQEGQDGQNGDDVSYHRRFPFGSGLHKHPVAFVPASDTSNTQQEGGTGSPSAAATQSVADFYLNLVLSKNGSSSSSKAGSNTGAGAATGAEDDKSAPEPTICPVCHLPVHADTDADADANPDVVTTTITTADQTTQKIRAPNRPTRRPHETTFAHQVCLPHSHPPSAFDRSRMGLAYLTARGWDPDARRGLGAAQQGIQFPLKPRAKEDGLGVGARPRSPSPSAAGKRKDRYRDKDQGKEKKARPLDAGKVRKMARDDVRRAARIRRELFGNGPDLEKYLGSGASSF